MKKENSIREQLGITQEDLALLLQVSRSQLSLYELGIRDLPLAAKQKLTAMLLHIQTLKFKKENEVPINEIYSNEKKKIIEELLFINMRKQMNLNKKINAIIKKQHSNNLALHLIDFFNTNEFKSTFNEQNIATSIENKTKKSLLKNNWQIQMQLQFQKEGLLAEENYFRNVLKTIK